MNLTSNKWRPGGQSALAGKLAPLAVLLLLPLGASAVASTGSQRRSSPGATNCVVTSDGTHAAVSDMSKTIRLVNLAEQKVVAENKNALLKDLSLVFRLGHRVLALGQRGMAVLDETNLETVTSCRLETPLFFPVTCSPQGDAFVTGYKKVWGLHRLSERGGQFKLEPFALELRSDLTAASFSPNGKRLALATAKVAWIIDPRTGTTLWGSERTALVKPSLSISTLAFLDEERLVLGWGTRFSNEALGQESAGVTVVNLRKKEPAQVLEIDQPPKRGAVVTSLLCDPERDLMLASVFPGGRLVGLREKKGAWNVAYQRNFELDYETLRIEPDFTRAEALVSGMKGSRARVINLETGETVLNSEVAGLVQLQSAAGTLVVGLEQGQLAVRQRP